MIPRIGAPPDPKQRYRLRPGAYAILPRNGLFLLTVQTGDPDEVQLPGGGIDPGESSLQALHREVWEETGWHIARPRRLGAFRRFAYMPEYDRWAEKLCNVFLAFPTQQLNAPVEPGHSVIWMDGRSALKAIDNDGDRLFLARYLSRARPLNSNKMPEISSGNG